jgi:hypothetical protein
MALEVVISSITGKSPFDIYICQTNGANCLYINTIEENSYRFLIPSPYDVMQAYMLKIIDANKSIIIGNQTVE